MPVEVGIWKLGPEVQRVHFTAMPDEAKLEEIIASDISIVDPRLLLIGRQVPTPHGGFIDLLAMDPDGNLVVIELKRGRTPRDVVAQALDYASWVRHLEDETIAGVYNSYNSKYQPGLEARSLDDAFKEHFDVKEMPEALNEAHEIVVVAGDLDASTERIVTYLSETYDVAINVVFFRFFLTAEAEFLSRVWLIDPSEVDSKTIESRAKIPWNGEFYVSFGERPRRRWKDARKYSYIAGGGGSWYSNTLQKLKPGDRFWVNVPGYGYVAVGMVVRPAQPITSFNVYDEQGTLRPITEVVTNAPDPNVPEDELEHYVSVKWIKTLPLSEAIKEKGFFGNQNTVAQPKDPKWEHTVERLKSRFNIGMSAPKESAP